jgi:Protein of unknown function (DUF3108)
MYKAPLLIFLCVCLLSFQPGPANNCSYRNVAFKSGESITYYVFYTLAGIWVHAGNVNFTATQTTLNNKAVYHVVGNGSTLPSYDWVYKVRDRYESFIDTGTLLPYKFVRHVEEGGYRKDEIVTFDRATNIANSKEGNYRVPECVQDVLSEMYMARNIDFNKYKKGDLIPFDLFLDNEVFNMYIRFLGKETIKTRYGKFRCFKFKPLLLKGTIFEGGEKMTVWVTDDDNRLPVRVESPISVGSIKVDMMMFRNLRHPLTSNISNR